MRRILIYLLMPISLSLTSIYSGASDERFADFEGVRIHYTDVGQGSIAIVFVHGWACSTVCWEKNATEFPSLRVLVIDLPGHGQSDKPRAEYTIEYFARSVNAVLTYARVKRTVLVGHSMGVPIVRQYYRLFPEKTLGLVVVDGPLREIRPKREMEQFIEPFRKNYDLAMRSIAGNLDQISDEGLRQKISTALLETPDYVAVRALEGEMDEKIWKADEISVPVLAILAEGTDRRPDVEAFYRSIAPRLEFEVWRGVSHFLMIDQSQRFNEVVKKFISENELL